MGESGEGCGKDRFQKGRDNSTPGGPPGSFDRTGGDDLEKDRKGFLCWVMEGVKKSGFFYGQADCMGEGQPARP